MREILDILDNLAQLSGNAQIDYLNTVKSPLLKEVFEYTYDTHKKYKIDEGKFDRVSIWTHANENKEDLTLDSWKKYTQLLDKLATIKSANDQTVQTIKEFIYHFDMRYSTFLRRVLFKDLRIGMNTKKFQKVWSDFLVEPQVQLAKAIEDRQIFEHPLYSRKYDGKRVWWDTFKPMSRTNKECTIAPVQHIINELKGAPTEMYDYILDGELLYFENGKEDFQKGISLCQRDDRLPGCENICYVIFDMINKEKFYSKEPDVPFKEEYSRIVRMLYNEHGTSPCYSLLPTFFDHVYIARQDEDDSKLMPLCIQHGWEGLMVRNADCPYEYKRTTNLLKIKEMHDMELKLIDMEQGSGKNEGVLGAFWVDYNGYRVQVGSGFTDEQRQKYWYNKDKYIGQMVKVQYFEKTINQDGNESLRFPVFKAFRNMETMEEYT